MNEEKRTVEGEMGSGDSDDEFYNVKLPCTPTVSSASASANKLHVKKIYSPSRTKVKYDYKFDSSSDEESDNLDNSKNIDSKSQSLSNNETNKNTVGEVPNDKHNLPENTFKVVKKINEELKNFKKTINEKQENIGSNPMTTLGSNGNVPKSQMGVVSPVVVVPPPMVVPQAPVMNMTPMMVPSPNHIVGIGGTMLGAPSPIGGIISNPNSTLPNVMMAMNTMQNQISGMVGMQSNIVGLSGPGAMTRQNVMGLQANMMRMAGNSVFNIPRPGVGVQNPNNLVGMTAPGSLMGIQNLGNATGLVVNPSGLMVMGVNNLGTPTTQAGVLSNSRNGSMSISAARPGGAPQGNQPVRPIPPPPPFLGTRNRAPGPGNFKWPTNMRNPQTSINAGSVTSLPPVSGPDDKDRSDDHNWEDKEKSQTEANSSKSDPYESQSSSSSSSSSPSSPPPPSLPLPTPIRDSSNTFKNDGSFMEMFMKMKNERSQESSSANEPGDSKEKSAAMKKAPVILSGIVGKRRGGRVLKTGLVKKVKKESELEDEKRPKDAWSMYMAEVKKYREASCEEEGKTRPLVK